MLPTSRFTAAHTNSYILRPSLTSHSVNTLVCVPLPSRSVLRHCSVFWIGCFRRTNKTCYTRMVCIFPFSKSGMWFPARHPSSNAETTTHQAQHSKGSLVLGESSPPLKWSPQSSGLVPAHLALFSILATKPHLRMKITDLRFLNDHTGTASRRLPAQDTTFHNLQKVTFGMSKGKTESHSSSHLKQRRQPHGFMQSILNIPVEQNGLTDFSSRKNILYASFGNMKVLEQWLPCGTWWKIVFWFQWVTH